MAGRIEQHPPARIRLIWQRGPQRDCPLRSRAEIVSGEVKVHNRCPWPCREDISVDLLRHQYRARHLDPDAGLLRPQLAATERAR